MGLEDREWFREEIRRRREGATRGSPHSRRARSPVSKPPPTRRGSGGGRFTLFVKACLTIFIIIGPLWAWTYHENVPIAVTAWQANVYLNEFDQWAGLGRNDGWYLR